MNIFKSTNKIISTFVLSLAFIPMALLASLPGNDKREFTDTFECPGDGFVNSASDGAQNKYFPLVPSDIKTYNTQACFDEGECDEVEQIIITVLEDDADYPNGVYTVAAGVETRVVHEYETVDGDLIEQSWNYFAECIATGDVYYFGETVDNYDEEGEIDNHEGSWEAGVEGASPGIIMPGTFLLGSRYFQEVAENALDRGENVAMGLTVGDFDDCVQVNDTNALEDPKGKEFDEKLYCPDVGLVKDEDMELID